MRLDSDRVTSFHGGEAPEPNHRSWQVLSYGSTHALSPTKQNEGRGDGTQVTGLQTKNEAPHIASRCTPIRWLGCGTGAASRDRVKADSWCH